MSFQDSQNTGSIGKICLILMTTTALAACTAVGGDSRPIGAVSTAAMPNGPQNDYPLVIGEPYSIGDSDYTPADVLNYDEVGYLAEGSGMGITGGHHTLPLPSYVEVTSLTTGRTILARLEQRGPMASNHLVSLSPAAMAQLGAEADTPVRVRRVNPPEAQRAMLRGDQLAPLRMDTPMSLVEVLRRRLPAEGSASLRAQNAPADTAPLAELAPVLNPVLEPSPAVVPPSVTGPMPAIATETVAEPLIPARELPTDEPVEIALPEIPASSFEDAFGIESDSTEVASVVAAPVEIAEAEVPEPVLAPEPVIGGFIVQAAAFSTQDRADRAAEALEGQVTRSGRFYRVRTGPFASRAQAAASLANVQAAGYSDARIYTNE